MPDSWYLGREQGTPDTHPAMSTGSWDHSSTGGATYSAPAVSSSWSTATVALLLRGSGVATTGRSATLDTPLPAVLLHAKLLLQRLGRAKKAGQWCAAGPGPRWRTASRPIGQVAPVCNMESFNGKVEGAQDHLQPRALQVFTLVE